MKMTAEDRELLKRIPIDHTYNRMERTDYICREWNGKQYVYRVVYMHKPTRNLYYKWVDGCWFGTYPEYCYNKKTGTMGRRF